MIRPALFLLALMLPAAAQTPPPGGSVNKGKDVTDLITLCRGSVNDASGKARDAPAGLQCLRYLEGFKDGLAGGEPKYCAPGVTLGAQVDAFLRWADSQKAPFDQPRNVTLVQFLSETYPCKK